MNNKGILTTSAAVLLAASGVGLYWQNRVDKKNGEAAILLDEVICKHPENRRLFNETYSRATTLKVLDALLHEEIEKGDEIKCKNFGFMPSVIPPNADAISFKVNQSDSDQSLGEISSNLIRSLTGNDNISFYFGYSEESLKQKLAKKVDEKAGTSLAAEPVGGRFIPDHAEIYANDGDIKEFREKAKARLEKLESKGR